MAEEGEENFLDEQGNGEQFEGEPVLAPTTDYLKELTVLPENFPQRLKKIYWSYYSKDLMLANLDKPDMLSIKNRVGLLVAISHVTQPDYEYTNEQLLDYTNLKHWVQNVSLRGKEGFERVMETQQTHLGISRNEAPTSLISPRRQGFLGRVFGVGGGKR